MTRNFRTGLAKIVPSLLFFALLLQHCPISALTRDEQNTIEAFRKVAPSVVNITTQACEPEAFFCAVPSSGSGSGIILEESGMIVTNYHVIVNSGNIEVALANGHRFKATMLGASPQDDLAIIKIEAGDQPLQAIAFSPPEGLKIGEKVMAIGNPFGLGQTLTVGTISMLGRDIKTNGLVLRDLIQTDAPINPGNSGGALVNSNGELVGMSTIILSPTGSNIGIGFAIPASRVKKVVPGIVRPWGKWLTWLVVFLLGLWIAQRIYSVGR